MHRKRIALGFRASYKAMGEVGLWLACLSRTPDIESAIEMYDGLIWR